MASLQTDKSFSFRFGYKVLSFLLFSTENCIIVNGDPPSSHGENNPMLLLIHQYKHFVRYPDYLRSSEIQSDCLAQNGWTLSGHPLSFYNVPHDPSQNRVLNWVQAHPSWCLLFASITAEWIPNIFEEGATPCPQHCSFFNRCVSEGWCLEGDSNRSSRQPAIFEDYLEPLCKWKVLISTCCKSMTPPKISVGLSFLSPTAYLSLWATVTIGKRWRSRS